MEVQENKFYEVKLLDVDKPSVTGNIYPREVVEKAIEELKKRRPGNLLWGEYGMPKKRPEQSNDDFVRRVGTIEGYSVSHAVDLTTLEVKDDALVGSVCPSGPLQYAASDALNKGRAAFAMRSFIQYKNSAGNCREVASCQIISFDLVDPSLVNPAT